MLRIIVKTKLKQEKIFCLPAGSYVLGKTVIKTEGIVFNNRDRPCPANNVFVFFSTELLGKKLLCEELERIQKRALRTIFPHASCNSALKEAGIPLFTTGERHYRLIFLMTLFLTLITSSQVCSHQKLITIGSCAGIESST